MRQTIQVAHSLQIHWTHQCVPGTSGCGFEASAYLFLSAHLLMVYRFR